VSFLEKLVTLTEGIEGLNGVSQALNKLIDANDALEATAAASQLAAELAITTSAIGVSIAFFLEPSCHVAHALN
jgi:hypothetical protein